MGVTAKKGSTKTTTYSLTGATLADVVKEIDKKGPVDPNESTRYSGKCLGRIDLTLTAADLDLAVTPGTTPVEVVAKLKSGGVVTSCEITLPKLASLNKLSAAAKKEWERFAKAVSTHEDGHADAYFAEAKKLAAELDTISVTATGANEKAAKAAATKALLDALKARYGGSTLTDRMKAVAKAYDAKTKHGESQGAKLDGSIA